MGLIKRHPAMFYQPYPPRINNNFYMDTADMVNYHDNVTGAATRRKVRIRWYGDVMGPVDDPVLEFKIKHGLVSTKRQYRVPGFAVERGFKSKDVMRRIVVRDLPAEVRSYLRTVSIVLMSNWMAHKKTDHRSVILELKYGIEDDAAASKVSTFFPFRMTKSSKYVQGIERVYM